MEDNLRNKRGFSQYFVNIFFSVLVLFFIFIFHLKKGISPFEFSDIFYVVSSVISINLFCFILKFLGMKNRFLTLFLFIVLLFFYVSAGFYHHFSKISIDYSVLKDNASLAFSPGSFSVIFDSVGLVSFILIPILILLFIFFEFKFKLISYEVDKIKLKGVVAFFFYGVFLFFNFHNYDESLNFISSIFSYYTNQNFEKNYVKGSHLLTKTGFKYSLSKKKTTPPIILLMVESFKSDFIGKNFPSSNEKYMPFFSDKIKEGIFLKHFYGNSIQTVKGQFATFFGTLPSFRKKIFSEFADRRFISFPKILQQNGYRTIFFQAYENLDFDNTRNFVLKNGFDVAKTAYDYLTPKEKKNILGWGMYDKKFYEIFFSYLDKNYKSSKTPFFVSLHTIMSHTFFEGLHKKDFHFFKNPKKFSERYINNIYMVDQGLKYFFEELNKRQYLKNALVIVTGDHSFPIGEHGITHNEAGFYDEFFRIPLFIYQRNKISSQLINRAYSQIDIAPTIIDFLHLTVKKQHFEGCSIFDESCKKPVLILQPYNGIYLGSIRYPYKYSIRLQTGNEKVFNLEKDPLEKTNILDSIEKNRLHNLRNDIKLFYLNQTILNKDDFL